MFSLLYGFWEYMFRKEEYRVLILGIDKAGKTTLLEQIKSVYTSLPGLDPEKILPTVGLNVGRVDAYKCQLIFWDLGGQPGASCSLTFVHSDCSCENLDRQLIAVCVPRPTVNLG